MFRSTTAAILVFVLAPLRIVQAHADGPVAPGDVWHHWNLSLPLLVSLGLLLYTHQRGSLLLHRRTKHNGWQRRMLLFWGACAALVAALISPLDALGETLLTWHMVQHFLLMLVAAPLLVLSQPLVPLLWGLPRPLRLTIGGWQRIHAVRTLWQVLRRPLVAVVLYIGVFWLWHMPGPYQAAVDNDFIHGLEHTSFLGIALLYWWVIAHPVQRHHLGAGILSIFAAGTLGGLLGALMTFAPSPWYPVYAGRAALWGLTTLEDQQLAGMIMWILPGTVYLTALAALVLAWLKALEARAIKRDKSLRQIQGEGMAI